jgi:transposase-like protein
MSNYFGTPKNNKHILIYNDLHGCPGKVRKTGNMIERINQELKRRSRVVRIFPNPASCRRLFTALLKEWHEDWISEEHTSIWIY